MICVTFLSSPAQADLSSQRFLVRRSRACRRRLAISSFLRWTAFSVVRPWMSMTERSRSAAGASGCGSSESCCMRVVASHGISTCGHLGRPFDAAILPQRPYGGNIPDITDASSDPATAKFLAFTAVLVPIWIFLESDRQSARRPIIHYHSEECACHRPTAERRR